MSYDAVQAIIPASSHAIDIRPQPPAFDPAQRLSFGDMLVHSVNDANQKMIAADRSVEAFILDGTIAPHQVTFALEEARLAFEMALQIRNRLVEAYQQMMNMQV